MKLVEGSACATLTDVHVASNLKKIWDAVPRGSNPGPVGLQVRTLVEAGAVVTPAREAVGRRPLVEAVEAGRLDMARILLALGAHPPLARSIHRAVIEFRTPRVYRFCINLKRFCPAWLTHATLFKSLDLGMGVVQRLDCGLDLQART